MTMTMKLLAESPAEGSSIYIVYDDVTLIATGFYLTAGPHAVGPMNWFYTHGGVQTAGIVPINTAVHPYNFPVAIPGVAGTDEHGEPTITWDIAPYGTSFS